MLDKPCPSIKPIEPCAVTETGTSYIHPVMEATLTLHNHLHTSRPFSCNSNFNFAPCHLSFRFQHQPSLFSGQSRLQVTRPPEFALRPCIVNCLPTRKKMEGASAGATVVLACVLGAICLSRRGCPPALAATVFWKTAPAMRSLSLRSIKSGRVALEDLLYMKRARLHPELLKDAENQFLKLLKQEKVDGDILQQIAWELEMSGKEDKAVRLLREKYDKAAKKGGDEAHGLGLLLAEMLIYQGDYKGAKELCMTLKDNVTNDARPLLFLAVTNVILGETDEAKEYWKRFKVIEHEYGVGSPPPTGEEGPREDEESVTFDQFREHMEVLRQEITATTKTPWWSRS